MIQEAIEQISEDVRLTERIRKGEHAAFAELYARHKQGVYLYCTRFLGTGTAAEDIMQDVFMKCFEQLRAGTEIGNIRGYLLSSSHNRCLNAIRDRKYPQEIGELEEFLPSSDRNIGAAVDLEKALQMIPADNREALLLCEYQGYSYEEISEMTAVPLSTVRKRIFRARQRLRSLLDPDTQR